MNKNRKRGFFITFEGPECAGKTTHINLLKEYFHKNNLDCITTREPGGTEIGEKLREIIKHHIGETAVVDEAELLLFAASRAQHVKKVISPALEKGLLVLCDRFTDSTTAYQGYARGMDMDFIKKLNNFAACGCNPNLTILLDLPVEESIQRSLRREENLFMEDRIESEEFSFHKRVREGFLKIAAAEPERVKIVSVTRPKDIVHHEIMEYVNNALKKF